MTLIVAIKKRLFVVVWIIYFITLEIGHYILEQFQALNMMIPFVIMGAIAYILPAHEFGLNRSNDSV